LGSVAFAACSSVACSIVTGSDREWSLSCTFSISPDRAAKASSSGVRRTCVPPQPASTRPASSQTTRPARTKTSPFFSTSFFIVLTSFISQRHHGSTRAARRAGI
jgi:hypothetical protein